MSDLPRIPGREIVKALKKIGYEQDRQRGSHIILRQTDSPHRRVTVPDHKEVAKGTLRAIIREVGLTVDEFKDILEIKHIPGEEKGNYHTLGGFVVLHLGHIPSAADHFEWQGMRFEVMDMDGNRVDKVLVAPIQPANTSDSDGTPNRDRPT